MTPHLEALCGILVTLLISVNGQEEAPISEAELDQLINNVFSRPNASTASPAQPTGNVGQPTGQGGISPNRPPVNPGNVPAPPIGGGEGCMCVPYYQCRNNEIVTNGEGLIDIRMGANECEDYLEVCCNPPEVSVQPITPRPTRPPQVPDHIGVPPTGTGHPTGAGQGCGIRNVDGLGFRITGAENNEANYGEFPWMTAILKIDRVDGGRILNVYQCGGSLIHPQVVLTAAHCVAGKEINDLKVRLGEWDTQTQKELYPYQDRLINRMVIHENFYQGALFNDVALLFLDRPVDHAPNVAPICMPGSGFYNFDGVTCYATGWGKDSYGKDGKYQVILKKIDLPVVPHAACQTALRKTRLGPYFKLDKSFICAGGEPGKDTCKGDGGSPLVCPLPNEPDRYVQVGLVAWGIDCGSGGTPGVYANILQLSEWVNNKLVESQYDTQHYKYNGYEEFE